MKRGKVEGYLLPKTLRRKRDGAENAKNLCYVHAHKCVATASFSRDMTILTSSSAMNYHKWT
jgi:hypothetical protein